MLIIPLSQNPSASSESSHIILYRRYGVTDTHHSDSLSIGMQITCLYIAACRGRRNGIKRIEHNLYTSNAANQQLTQEIILLVVNPNRRDLEFPARIN